MRRPDRVCRMAWAALLALAFVVVGLPADPVSSSPHHHGVQTVIHGHHAPSAPDGGHRAHHGDRDADCDFPAIDCCAMTLCHPGISVDPHDLRIVAAENARTSASTVRGIGSEPGVILPPPRRLPVRSLANSDNQET